MEETDKKDVIPKQKKGGKSVIIRKQEFPSVLEAMSVFKVIKQRFLNVNNWGSYSTSSYELIKADGTPKTGLAEESDIIKIDIPGPSGTEGKGYDWVQIEKIIDTASLFAIGVRTTSMPGSNKTSVAHFYSNETTNTFSVERHGKEVICEVNARNIVLNLKHKNLFDKIRNLITGMAGASGVSKLMWEDFLYHLMEGKEKQAA